MSKHVNCHFSFVMLILELEMCHFVRKDMLRRLLHTIHFFMFLFQTSLESLVEVSSTSMFRLDCVWWCVYIANQSWNCDFWEIFVEIMFGVIVQSILNLLMRFLLIYCYVRLLNDSKQKHFEWSHSRTCCRGELTEKLVFRILARSRLILTLWRCLLRLNVCHDVYNDSPGGWEVSVYGPETRESGCR